MKELMKDFIKGFPWVLGFTFISVSIIVLIRDYPVVVFSIIISGAFISLSIGIGATLRAKNEKDK